MSAVHALTMREVSSSGRRDLHVGIVGFGSIGQVIAKRLAAGAVPGVDVVGVTGRDSAKTMAALAGANLDIPVLGLSELANRADAVIECAPANLFEQIALPVLTAGKRLIVLSVGALLTNWHLFDVADRFNGQIVVPTGALLGLDAVAAAAEGTIHSVTMTTRKPIAGLLGAPYLVEQGIDIRHLNAPLQVFAGSARDAAIGFPANLNVAVALSLAGIGPDATRLEIWADPTVTRNCHRIVVESDSALLDLRIENIPGENPKTGRITPLSVLALLRKMNGATWIGS